MRPSRHASIRPRTSSDRRVNDADDSKEDLALSLVRDGQAAFAAALAARPREEDPLTAARSAFDLSLHQVPGGAEALPTYLSAMQMIDATPALLAAYLRYVHDH